jgi:hypothetical protein
MPDDYRMTRIEGLVDGVDYHQFYLQLGNPGQVPSYPMGGPPNRLLATTDSGQAVCVTTGIARGVVGLTIEFLDGRPNGVDESPNWQTVEEINVQAATPFGSVQLLEALPQAPFDAIELPFGSGQYRVRGCAVGRSLDFDVMVRGEPREHHLLQLWRVDTAAPPLIIRADDPWEHQGNLR